LNTKLWDYNAQSKTHQKMTEWQIFNAHTLPKEKKITVGQNKDKYMAELVNKWIEYNF
jgi:hypothetical protein